MKIGIYGGSFNPPHLGHLTAAVGAVRFLGLERLILIPAGNPPHKALAPDTPPSEHRTELVRRMGEEIAFETGIEVSVSEDEIRRPGKSYTADTVQALREQFPEDELWLLMGTDMFLTLQAWHEPQTILRCCGICAFGRTEADTEELFTVQRAYLQKTFPGARIVTMTLPQIVEISSTDLREKQADAARYLQPAVWGYILREHLYGTACDLHHLTADELRPIAMSYLKPKRMPHVIGTEQTAAELAKRWGADAEQARFAALLHDCTKRLSPEEHLFLAKHYGVALDELEIKAQKLMHAKTGAAIAREVFGADEEIVSAICWHTTGRPAMTTLEKVIYLADYMEPNRDFDGVEPLRKLVYEDIDRAMVLGLSMTVEDMQKRGNPIHHNTLEALEYYKRSIQ